MFDKFLNFYSKYPWVAIIIILQWFAAAYIIIAIDPHNIDVTKVMGITFAATILFAYFGFKVPKG